jgi:peptidoglycan/LPS O-acetylase OafA/YrhL
LIGSFLLYSLFGQSFPDLKIYAASIGLMQNWIFDHQIHMNISLWSIPVEVEFYIVYPFLYWLFVRYGFRVSFLFVFLCGCFGSIMFLYRIGNYSGSFFNYLAIWSSGAWLAEKYASNDLPKWSFRHGCFLFFVFTATVTLSGLQSFGKLSDNISFYLFLGWGLFFFLILWWVLGPGGRFFVLSNRVVRFFVFLGTISYSIYLLHFPLFKISSYIWMNIFGTKPESFLVPTLAVLIVIPFSWVFYRLIELPSIEIGRRLSKDLPK